MTDGIRKATIDDIELLVALRMDFLSEEFGDISGAQKEAIRLQLIPYFEKRLSDGTLRAIIAEEDGEVVSTAFLVLSELPASPAFVSGKIGTVLNVLTYPAYRRQGWAAKVLEAICGEARLAGVASVRLSATKAGEGLYRKLGFVVSKHLPMSMSV